MTKLIASAGRSPRLPPATQLAVVAALALGLLCVIFRASLVDAPLASQAVNEKPQAEPGAFRPTKEQWAGIRVATVGTRMFRPERVTEGNIAIDDDLTTPVFSPYSGGSSS
jgi:membrane fusion protein, heavy metal efflux system